ncbi:MAG: IclR family transcriptional regulator [Chloroflexota bacterium]
MGDKEAYPGTQSVQRAISLLKAFDDVNPAWGLSDLSREMGLNKTTVFRLMSALEQEGMVARAQDGESYILGPEIVVMGGRALRSNNLRTVARPELELLAEGTNETASLEILSEREMLVIDEIVGGHLMSGVPSLGSRWPLHASSTGLAMLAFLPDETADTLLPSSLVPVTLSTAINHADLRRELAATQARGYSIADETLEVGLIAIAAPVYNHDGQVVATVSVAGPKVRITPARVPEIGRQLLDAAGRISAQLGYRRQTSPVTIESISYGYTD